MCLGHVGHVSGTRVWVMCLGPSVWVMCLSGFICQGHVSETCVSHVSGSMCLSHVSVCVHMSGTPVWDMCLGHVSGTQHAGSMHLHDEASRQALMLLCKEALFSGLGPLGHSWNEDGEMETRGIVVREGAEGPG